MTKNGEVRKRNKKNGERGPDSLPNKPESESSNASGEGSFLEEREEVLLSKRNPLPQ